MYVEVQLFVYMYPASAVDWLLETRYFSLVVLCLWAPDQVRLGGPPVKKILKLCSTFTRKVAFRNQYAICNTTYLNNGHSDGCNIYTPACDIVGSSRAKPVHSA